MKICSRCKNNNINATKPAFKAIPSKPIFIPECVGELGKRVGKYVNTPEQKLLMAITALSLQPLIDLKFADDEKKHDAAIKSASKAIAGGLTGVTIRACFLKLMEMLVGYDANGLPKNNSFNRKYFFPNKAYEKWKENEIKAVRDMNKYTKNLGSLFAVAFMILFSNSKLDVPLTSDIQDFITGIVKENKTWTKSFHDVTSVRKNKINNWFNIRKEKVLKIGRKFKKIGLAIVEKDSDTTSATKENGK
ncbi:hypothetical protein IJ182_06345 [bacterium]|nr:hypothetical protein [bacterium]